MKTHENIQQVVYGRSMRLLQPVVPLLYQINPMVLCSHLTNSCLLIVHTRAASSTGLLPVQTTDPRPEHHADLGGRFPDAEADLHQGAGRSGSLPSGLQYPRW
jgi:hypothetical protein